MSNSDIIFIIWKRVSKGTLNTKFRFWLKILNNEVSIHFSYVVSFHVFYFLFVSVTEMWLIYYISVLGIKHSDLIFLQTILHMKYKWNVSLSVVSDSFETPWTVARQTPLSIEISRREYWSGLTFPPSSLYFLIPYLVLLLTPISSHW